MLVKFEGESLVYALPEEKIASRPEWYDSSDKSRGHSKLLHYTQENIIDSDFSDVDKILKTGDVLVLNNTKVINARFIFNDQSCEMLLCREYDDYWYALARPMKFFKPDTVHKISENLSIYVIGLNETRRFLKIKLLKNNQNDLRNINDLISLDGHVPIPPYIREGKSDNSDKTDYQTVYAKNYGSVAAPTAGLHFSDVILEKLKAKGVIIKYVTLHVGPASFLPVNDPDNYKPLAESYEVTEDTWRAIELAKSEKRRVIAVGTTVIRSLESFAIIKDKQNSYSTFIETELFITPGYKFEIVDCCFTNFHQPKTTHLLLVAAFVGLEALDKIYKHALENNYRFLSYGDSSYLEMRL